MKQEKWLWLLTITTKLLDLCLQKIAEKERKYKLD